jgi:uncharacterized protein YfeS
MEKEISFIISGDISQKAVLLRRQGTSYRDISKKLRISLRHARFLTKDVIMTKEQKKEILSKRKKLQTEMIIIDSCINNIHIKGKIHIKSKIKNGKLDKDLIFKCILNLFASQNFYLLEG